MIKKRVLTDKEKGILVEKTVAFLKTKEYILFAYIFGSFFSGKSFNDIDMGIFVSHEKPDSLLSLELKIERELGDILHIPVDVRIINNAPPSFVYNVLKSGTVIVDNNESLRTDFEALVIKKYFDFRHLRNEYLREIINAEV
jgi:predicted nucleotidyltransferase